MGILSHMDAILQMPMELVVESVPLEHECKAVLLGEPSQLRSIYELMLAQESGQWQNVIKLATQLDLSQIDVQDDYWHAMEWARNVAGK
jgi:EAL and modified HD-GYP domain-containing signal transduction protein